MVQHRDSDEGPHVFAFDWHRFVEPCSRQRHDAGAQRFTIDGLGQRRALGTGALALVGLWPSITSTACLVTGSFQQLLSVGLLTLYGTHESESSRQPQSSLSAYERHEVQFR